MSQVFDETTLATGQGHLAIGEASDSTSAAGGGRPRHGPPRGSHLDRPPIRDRSRQGAVHDLFYGGLSDPGPGCGGLGRHPPSAAIQPSTVPLPNSQPEVAR
jgi:hypothetical protein